MILACTEAPSRGSFAYIPVIQDKAGGMEDVGNYNFIVFCKEKNGNASTVIRNKRVVHPNNFVLLTRASTVRSSHIYVIMLPGTDARQRSASPAESLPKTLMVSTPRNKMPCTTIVHPTPYAGWLTLRHHGRQGHGARHATVHSETLNRRWEGGKATEAGAFAFAA